MSAFTFCHTEETFMVLFFYITVVKTEFFFVFHDLKSPSIQPLNVATYIFKLYLEDYVWLEPHVGRSTKNAALNDLASLSNSKLPFRTLTYQLGLFKSSEWVVSAGATQYEGSLVILPVSTSLHVLPGCGSGFLLQSKSLHA